jgi:hypothetical protein
VRRRRGRILLGDSTDGEAVLLWPIRFKCAEIFSWTPLYTRINTSWQCVYSVATCAEFDLCRKDLSERNYHVSLPVSVVWLEKPRPVSQATRHHIPQFRDLYLFIHYNFLCFYSCLCNCVWRVSENAYHSVPWDGSWKRYFCGRRKMRLGNGFQNVFSYLDGDH